MTDSSVEKTTSDAPRIECAILFADLGQSTHLYEALGDQAAHAVTGPCLERMIELVTRHEGTLIKTIGDEVMATFSSADDAHDAAVAIVASVRQESGRHGQDLGAHVGFHLGSVLPEAGDVFGDAVNVAARMVSLAKVDEVLTTRDAVERLSDDRKAQVRHIDRRTVKGRDQELDVFEIGWQPTGETSMIRAPYSHELTGGRLILLEGTRRWLVHEEHPTISIGRAPENEIVLADTRVSRRHARIRLRHGKFVLHDESANGTLVMTSDGRTVPVHREDITLQGSGRIGVNPGTDASRELPIAYSVET